MGDLDLASSMIKSASEAGATWAKFQTWSVKRLSSGPWDSDGRREIYNKAELSADMHAFLINTCNQNNIRFLSSAFSIQDAKLLLSLGQKSVKIPSFEVANRDLLKFSSTNFERVFISTGTATAQEIKDLLNIVDINSTTIMHCVSSYPCPIELINLPRINYLKSLFSSVGFSDHTSGIDAAVFSLSYGVDVIEKHFTVDHELPGRDNKFAILPEELKSLSSQIINFNKATSDHGIDYQQSETETRSLYRGRFNHG